jgi:hypothetical protein
METYYIINSYIKTTSKIFHRSEPFSTKEDAKNAKEILDNNDITTNIIFKCRPLENKIKKNKKMKLYKYRNGYLLVPDKTSPYYGMERLNNGCWCEDVNGWLYDKNEYDKLCERNYTIMDKLKIDYSNYNMNTLEIYFYSNGFVLSPKETYKYYGQQYLIGGIWDEKQKGWYFKSIKKYKKFVKLGANDYYENTFME